jgi:DNA-binding transcriptional MerR regulator
MLKDDKLIDISQMSKKLGLMNKKTGKPMTHTLRFWESQFSQIKPIILEGRRRYYNKKNQDLIELIKFLLKDQGLTIQGAKKVLNNRINNLDEHKSSSIKLKYISNKLKIRSKNLLEKIKKIKKIKN